MDPHLDMYKRFANIIKMKLKLYKKTKCLFRKVTLV